VKTVNAGKELWRVEGVAITPNNISKSSNFSTTPQEACEGYGPNYKMPVDVQVIHHLIRHDRMQGYRVNFLSP